MTMIYFILFLISSFYDFSKPERKKSLVSKNSTFFLETIEAKRLRSKMRKEMASMALEHGTCFVSLF